MANKIVHINPRPLYNDGELKNLNKTGDKIEINVGNLDGPNFFPQLRKLFLLPKHFKIVSLKNGLNQNKYHMVGHILFGFKTFYVAISVQNDKNPFQQTGISEEYIYSKQIVDPNPKILHGL